MTPQEALKSAIEFFEQRGTREKWDFGPTTNAEIAIALRQLAEHYEKQKEKDDK